MVYGRQITIVTGAYKPTYNWGGSHCTIHRDFGGSLKPLSLGNISRDIYADDYNLNMANYVAGWWFGTFIFVFLSISIYIYILGIMIPTGYYFSEG